MRRVAGLLLAVGLLLPLAARAHGGGVPQVTRQPVGEALLYVWTDPASPRAGDALHVTVAVTLPAADGSEMPVTDAEVRVRLEPASGGDGIDLVAELGSGVNRVFYEADAELPERGLWQVSVDVDGAQGSGGASFALEVAAGGISSWLLWLLVAAAGAAVGWFVWQMLRRSASRQAPAPVAGNR